MACPTILTGDRFLSRVLGHIDCQAQTLGSFGYTALGEPGGTASLVVSALLTLFIALFGARLLIGQSAGGRDVVSGVLKIGIVLTLAFSWPAFRVLAYDVVLTGPAEIASTISPSTLPSSGSGFTARLQNADNAIVSLTRSGSGRQTGALLDTDQQAGGFQGVAAEDESSFAWARIIWLSSVIGTLAALRLLAGLLLALAPLAAAMLLFEATRGLFAGWVKGLVMAAVGATGATIMLAAELAILEPWLADAIRLRSLGYAAPSAPTELLAITLAFALAGAGLLYILAKVSFARGWVSQAISKIELPSGMHWEAQPSPRLVGHTEASSSGASNRAQRLADHVEQSMRREELGQTKRITSIHDRGSQAGTRSSLAQSAPTGGLAQPSRRTSARVSTSGARRDIVS